MRSILKIALLLMVTIPVSCKRFANPFAGGDKVVAVVGQSVVLYSEVERYSKALVEQSKQQGYTSQRDPRCEALEHLIIQKLLYNQSQIDSLTVPMDRVAERVQQLVDEQILERGSVAALEMYYHKPIFNIREELRETIEEGAYASEMERTIKDKVHVTPGEVEKFVKGMSKDSVPIIPEQYVFAQIVRYPSNADEAKLRAQERLLELRERIINGDKFDMLARTYSEDPQSAIRGGDLGLMTKEMLVPEFAEAMMKLKPGQVSGVVETDYGFHLIQLIEKIGSQYHARHILLKPQYTDMDMEEPYNVLDSVQRQIVDGTITFEEAAMKYSQDKYSKQNGGLASNLEQLEIMNYGDPTEASVKFYKDYLNPDDFRALEKLEIDGVSKPYTTQDYRQRTLCKVVKLKEVIPAHPANIKEDYVQLEKLALAVKQEREFVRWLKSKVDGMYIRIDEDFKDCEFEHSFLLK